MRTTRRKSSTRRSRTSSGRAGAARGPARVSKRPNGGVRIGVDDRSDKYTVEELAEILFDAFLLGFAALADWNARPRPARGGQ